jgi:hypothetical protein
LAFVVFLPIPPVCISVPLRLFLQAFWQEDEALDPIDVGFFGADGIMFGSDGVPIESSLCAQYAR